MTWQFILGQLHQFLVGLLSRPGTIGVTVPLGSGYDRDADTQKKREHIVEFCRNQMGEKYVFGVEVSPGRESDSWDCSEMVQNAYENAGVPFCDGAQAQHNFCSPVSDPLPGDLGFLWSEKRDMIGHVMVFAGAGQLIHAVGGRGVVEDPIDMWVYKDRFRGWRRHPEL